jgi:hypothetical protein
MTDVKPWPEGLVDAHPEVVRLFEETFAQTTQTPEELRARARELREEAERTEVLGYREVAIALADRYEQAAASRVASR